MTGDGFTVTRRAAVPLDEVRLARDAARVRALKARRRRLLTLGLGTLAFTAIATPLAALTFFMEPDGLIVTTDKFTVASGVTEAGNTWTARVQGASPGSCYYVELGPSEGGGCGVPPVYGFGEMAAADGRPTSIEVSGLVPEDVTSVTVLYEDGTAVSVQTTPVPEVPGAGRLFVVVDEPSKSRPVAIEGRRADGAEAFSERFPDLSGD